MAEKRKPKVLIIGTGGTMGGKVVNGKMDCGEIKQEEMSQYVPGIEKEVEIKNMNIFRGDSSDFTPANWITLANTIYYHMNDYDGIVITSGTNTLVYMANAISFLIQNKNIPIVFAGSIAPIESINTDVRRLLRQAILVAAKADIAETLIISNNKIHRAVRTKRVNASELQVYDSINQNPLGKVERFIELTESHQRRGKRKPIIYNEIDTEVATLKVYPGFDGSRINTLIDDGATGIVIEAFGVGNIPMNKEVKDAIKYANKKNVPIVITSECATGSFLYEIYKEEIGNRFKGLKVIPVFDMLTETAYIKLMWVLAQTKKFPQVKKMMQTSYNGEINEIKHKKTIKRL